MTLAHGIVARFNVGFDDIISVLYKVDIASSVYIEVLDTNPRIGIAIGEKYFFRADNSLAATTIVIEDRNKSIVKVIATGARSGILDLFDLGSSRDYTRLILDRIAEKLGAKYEVVAEVNYLDTLNSPQLYTRIGI